MILQELQRVERALLEIRRDAGNDAMSTVEYFLTLEYLERLAKWMGLLFDHVEDRYLDHVWGERYRQSVLDFIDAMSAPLF